MVRAKFIVLAPAVILLLLMMLLKDGAASPRNTITSKADVTNITTTAKADLNVTYGNISTTNPSIMSTHPSYIAPHFSGMVKRLVYVTLVLSAVIGLYFLVRFCRSGRRKPRKYGVVKTPGDMEMRPLESDDDDDDEDVTMFNRKD